MNIQLKFEPFHHIIIDNFYSEEDLELVLGELETYNYESDYKKTGGVLNPNTNMPWKKNKGYFLVDEQLKQKSFILNNFVDFVIKLHKDPESKNNLSRSWFFSQEFPSNFGTLITYYENGDYYQIHRDSSIITSITWIDDGKKQFSGGDLIFPDYNYTVQYKKNRTFLFFGRINHEVSPIIGEGKRFAISHFFNTM